MMPTSLVIAILATMIKTACSVDASKLLPTDYDASMVPAKDGEPVEVETEIAVLNVRSIREADLMFTLDIFFTMHWDDYRVQGPPTPRSEHGRVLDSSWKPKLWTPEVNFKNSVQNRVVHGLSQQLYITIYNTTRIRMSARLSLDLLCEMDFSFYPHDTQSCFIDVISLSHNNRSVLLKWYRKGLHISPKLYMTRFHVVNSNRTTCDKTYHAVGTLSCLRGNVVLERFIGHFIIQKYIPSTLIVMMVMVGFWIPSNAYPARTALSITGLLALITQQMQASTLNVSYIMALNVWMLICITFVFLSLIELALSVVWATRKENRDRKRRENNEKLEQRFTPLSASLGTDGKVVTAQPGSAAHERSSLSNISQGVASTPHNGSIQMTPTGEASPPPKKPDSICKILCMKLQSNLMTQSPNSVDTVARIVFPTVFAIAAAFYYGYVASK